MKIKDLIRSKYCLIVIIVIAAFLRLWNLSSIPPHLTPDEAALGYNAYSVLKTGRDEHGQLLPIIFKSFGDYKPGLYIYLTVPFVATFGLNEWAVRLPSALAGVAAVWLIYLITKKLRFKNSLGILAAALLAISPWHIQFSRGAWEVNIALTLTLAGIYFFLKSFEKPKHLMLSALFFSLTLITYQGAKLSTAIVVILLVAVYWKKVRYLITNYRNTVVQSTVIGVVIILPILISMFQGKAGRLTVFSVFSHPRPHEYTQTFLDQGDELIGDINYYLFHSETNNFARGVMGRWFNHFSGRFLFFEGDWQNPRHTPPNQGVLLMFGMLLLPVGFVALLREKSKAKIIILLWLVFAPLPAVLSRDQVHAVRSYNLVVPLTIVSAFGLRYLLLFSKRLKNPLLLVTYYLLLFVFFSSTLLYYLDSYFIHTSKGGSKYWDYGHKQIVETVTPIQSDFEEVKVQQSFAQPYIYFLFFQRYDPAKYQAQVEFVESGFAGDVGYIEHLDNICFCAIDWSVNRGESGKLIVGDPIRIPPEDSRNPELFNVVSEIDYLDGNAAFRVIEIL